LKKGGPAMTDPLSDNRFVCSWSGGKDSCLALWRAIRAGGYPACLLTMLNETGVVSRSHGLPRSLLEGQAASLGIPIFLRAASWQTYEAEFSLALREFRERGVASAVFGDIDMDDHRDWCRRVSAGAGLAARHPLWKEPRRKLLEEFIAAGFQAVIVVVEAGKLGSGWIGRSLDADAVTALEKAGVDPCGEAGEYHTAVTDGPLFREAVPLPLPAPAFHEGYWFYRGPDDWPEPIAGLKGSRNLSGPFGAREPACDFRLLTKKKPFPSIIGKAVRKEPDDEHPGEN
jgi:diphthine-ammonia ligase